MTWIPRTPKRYDFCGCPPCPLCFVWAGDTGILDGLTKFTRDMLGTRTPTPQEKVVLANAAEAIHVANLGFHQRVDAELEAVDRAQHTERQMGEFLALQRANAARPPALTAKPCLDDMDLSKVNDPPAPQEQPAYYGFYSDGQTVQFYAPTVVDTRREQAEADAKRRMKEMSRAPQRR